MESNYIHRHYYFRMVFSSFDVSFYVSNIKNAISFWRFYLVFKMQLDRLRNEHHSTECAHSIFCSLSNCIIFFTVILIHYPFSNTFFFTTNKLTATAKNRLHFSYSHKKKYVDLKKEHTLILNKFWWIYYFKYILLYF